MNLPDRNPFRIDRFPGLARCVTRVEEQGAGETQRSIAEVLIDDVEPDLWSEMWTDLGRDARAGRIVILLPEINMDVVVFLARIVTVDTLAVARIRVPRLDHLRDEPNQRALAQRHASVFEEILQHGAILGEGVVS